MNLFKILVSLLSIISFCLSTELVQKDLNENNFSINKGSFKVTEFDKMIKNIKVSNEANIEIDFIDDNTKPLRAIKIFAKEVGTGNILVTFVDNSTMHININIVENLATIISVAKQISPKIDITQTNGKVILKGSVDDEREKNKIIDLFAKAGIDVTKDLVDLLSLRNPDKMVKVKLYAVEINNNKGLDLKNNWFVSSKNYMKVYNPDGTYYNLPLDNYTTPFNSSNTTTVTNNTGTSTTKTDVKNIGNSSEYYNANAQRNTLVNDAIDKIMANSVSLTGGLTGAANYLGKYFNAGLTLNYLSSKGVANILDETTLITLENKKAVFHAGGTIYLKVQTTTDQGVPSTEIQNINYGLQLDIQAKNIVNDDYVSLDIITKSTQIDWARTVDGIPSFTEKSIQTNVIAGNNATIILGGLINTQNSKDIDKIPLLGDIPILGYLFTSQAFREGKSELVFFITPEIIDPRNNNQNDLLLEKKDSINNVNSNAVKSYMNMGENKSVEVSSSNTNQEKTTETDSKSEHEKRVKELLGN
ncbi:MAG: type II and III secretion system protein [Aliarcobacter sp.]|nr:type II and III secretion system protein [Aliarcobacter sp.]